MIALEKLIVVGSGPAGLTAAIYGARALLKPLVISGPCPGGQLVLTEDVENFPGFVDGVQGIELMERMKAQALRLGARVVTDTVALVDVASAPFHVLTTSGSVYVAGALVVAPGCEPKTLGLEHEAQLMGRGVSTCATCDGFFYRNKRVVIVGGGSTAATDALYLAKVAKAVTVVCRGQRLSCDKTLEAKLIKRANVRVMTTSRVVAYVVKGEADKPALKAVQIESGQVSASLVADGVFLAIGTRPKTDAFSGLKRDAAGYI